MSDAPQPAPGAPAGPGARGALLWAGAALLLALILRLWQGDAYWNSSDGVYALSARQILEGDVPYRDFAAAQPPLLYYVGAAILGIADSLNWLRAVLVLVQVATGGLVALAVLRLTGMRAVAFAAGLLALLTPWALHEHAQLVPETFAAPLLLAGALVLARPGREPAGGALLAAAALFKLAFALPGLLVCLAAARRWRALAWSAAIGVAALLVGVAVFGTRLLEGTIVAQLQTGQVTFSYLTGLWAQAGWNLLVLLVPAGLALVLRGRAAEPLLLRTVAAAAAGGLLLVLSLAKQGAYLNVLVVAEAPLLVLAACGVAWGWGAAAAPRPALRRGLLAGAGLLWVVQLATLVAAPSDPKGFTRPFSAPAHGVLMTDAEVDAAVATARACPPGARYAGWPAIAFRAERMLPGRQPDPFILATDANHELAARAAADRQVCAP